MDRTESHIIVMCFMLLIAGGLGYLVGVCKDSNNSNVEFWGALAPTFAGFVIFCIMCGNIARLVFFNL